MDDWFLLRGDPQAASGWGVFKTGVQRRRLYTLGRDSTVGFSDSSRGWRLQVPSSDFGPIGPKYRGAFEAGERAPKRIRVVSKVKNAAAVEAVDFSVMGGGANTAGEVSGCAVDVQRIDGANFTEGDVDDGGAEGFGACAIGRFTASRLPSLFRRRSFGVSVEIPPEEWIPAGTRRGWYFFRFCRNSVVLGLWSSLPATWLAQDIDGNPLEPPWRELWTFGTEHSWGCRIGSVDGDEDLERFREECLSGNILESFRLW